MEPPTSTSTVLVLRLSIVGQTLNVPLTSTLPVRAPSWQRRWTETGVVAWAVTVNPAEPEQLSDPSVEVAFSWMEKPEPAGSGPITAPRVVLLLTSMLPVFENEAGPEML